MKKIVLILHFFTLPFFLQAADDCIPAKPNPPRLVNDYAQVLSPQTESYLERTLVGFNDTTSTQIAIVTVDDLCGDDPAFFAFELGEKWRVGNAKFDNGIVVLVRPKKDGQKGHAFIATGYGLEGVLPDAIAKRIVENEMIPYFKQNNYDQGIIQAATVIMEITGGEYSAKSYNGRGRKKGSVIPFIVILFFVFIMIFGVIGRARRYSRKNDIGLWAALWLMGSMSGRHSGHYNNFRSGGGGFGGFGGGGGGFGGFGGGSFGGGGAGGSW
ncbi:MAG: hypothetical protein CMP59_02425 [Flavobacteriales bacterium]|nr:hypothetical protein [Flavobacteriales bacterium]